MPNFKTHFSFGFFFSTVLSLTLFYFLSLTVDSFFLIFFSFLLGSISPDIDLKHSIPAKILSFCISFFISFYMFLFIKDNLLIEDDSKSYFLRFILLLSFSVSLLFLIYFLTPKAIAKFTNHRGVFHSSPMIVFCFLFLYFILMKQEKIIRIYIASGFSLGYFLHLFLDDIKKKARTKSAFKLKGLTKTSTFLIYFFNFTLLIYFIYDNSAYLQSIFQK